MGLPASIYKDRGHSCAGPNGISTRHEDVVVVNVPGPFDPREDAPAVLLRKGHQPGSVIAVPAELVDGEWVEARNGVGPMMGGCYIATSDSRLGEAVQALGGPRWHAAVPLHDRFETAEQYASYAN